MSSITKEEHKKRHEELHRALDELLADFLIHTGNFPSKTTVLELVNWSYDQTALPTEVEEEATL